APGDAAHLLLLPALDAALRVHVPVPGHAGLGAGDRRGAARNPLHAPRARHPAQGQRLGGSLAQHLAVDRLHGGGHGHRGDLLSEDAGLTMKRALTCILLLIASCTQDPVHPPEIPAAGQYTPTPVTEERLAPGEDIAAPLWTLLKSPALDGLVRQALEASPTLARAGAKLRQAQEDLSARTGGTRFPTVDAKLSANRVDVNPQSLGVQALPVQTPFNLYLASVGVSYTLDLFGANRRELEALQAGVDYQRYELEAARLMLAGNVVTASIREASLREQIAATEELVVLQERQL